MSDSGKPKKGSMNTGKLDQLVINARKDREKREQDYRAQSLKLHPWVCGRCGRVFTRENLHELTVHHKDHNHDNNPPDGSNWENLCLFCHDNEHQRHVEFVAGGSAGGGENEDSQSVHNPFAALKDMLKSDKED